MKASVFVLLVLVLGVAAAQAEADAESFQAKQIVSGQGVIWGMAFIEPRRLLITERAGAVKLVDLDSGKIEKVSGAPAVVAKSQGGLMDVAVAPDYSRSGWLYFTYSKPVTEGSATALARARLRAGNLVDWRDLFVSNLHLPQGAHYGGRVAFDGDGHIFITHGERHERDNAQNLANHGGTVLRLNLDGSVPEDNPFVGKAGAAPETWSYGHRNPQGIQFDKNTGRLWEIEHGPRGGDEINLVKPGRNYGWPVISYGREYSSPEMVGEGTHKAGMEQPVKYYVPSIAPSSLLLYDGDAFPHWQGDLFAGALVLTHLNHLEVEGGKIVAEHRYLEDLKERIRQVIQGPDGTLYLSTDSGKIIHLSPEQ